MRRKPKPSPQPDAISVVDARNRSRQIGKALHIVFDAVTREPVPSEFLDLLERLDQQEQSSRQRSAS
jgi:hypothetical protein